jgi:uncharacterized membrane protein
MAMGSRMNYSKQGEKQLYIIFIWGIVFKGINGLLEILGSIALLFSDRLLTWIKILAQAELQEDPHDLVANYIQHHFAAFSLSSKSFIFFYLLSHGVIKLLLAIALLRKRLWAYPAAIFVFILFVIYQLYRYSFTHSVFLVLITIFDIFIVWLTWHEYKRAKASLWHIRQ